MTRFRYSSVHLLPQLLLAALVVAGFESSLFAEERPTIGEIERLDPALDALVPPDAKMEIIVDGLDWCEGPLWIPADGGFLIFSDIPPNKIYRWDAKRGKQMYLYPSGYTGQMPRGGEVGTNGSTLDADGRLILCQHGDRRVARMLAPLAKPEPKYATVASKYDGKRFNSPNDAVAPLQRRDLLHRSALRPGKEHGRSGQGAATSRASIASRRTAR